jgi:CelD/BcsL family acetyltransferase involved in cellulose biosynthesis
LRSPRYYLLDTQYPLSYVAISKKRHSIYVLGGIRLKAINNKYVFETVNFDRFVSYRNDSKHSIGWECLFVLPQWLRVWWQEFGGTSQLSILCARYQEDVIGIAPLMVNGQRATFLGGADVCDYLDFIVSPAKAADFFNMLLDHIEQQGLAELDLGPLRPDSAGLSRLARIAEDRGCEVSLTPHDVSLEVALPGTWDAYLGMLKGKQRHEVKRKFRRLQEAADINFRVVESAEQAAKEMDTFFTLFKLSAHEKENFLTEPMKSYFRSLAQAMADARMLKLFFLELDAEPVAASMCFDFNATRHLYNSGFDPRFRSLSVGLMCKVLSIKDAIEKGRKKYDFLKGAETYKYRLGGSEVPLSYCKIGFGRNQKG